MKTKVLLGVAVIGLATVFTAPARAGVSIDIRIGFPPLPRVVFAPPPLCAPPVVVVRPPVVVCAPPPVMYYPPPVVMHHPRFVPPGHARRHGHVEYRHHHGRHHGRH